MCFVVKHFLDTGRKCRVFPCLFRCPSMAIYAPTTFSLSPPNPKITSQTERCFRFSVRSIKNFYPIVIFLIPLAKRSVFDRNPTGGQLLEMERFGPPQLGAQWRIRKNHGNSLKIVKNQENSIQINRFWKLGRLGPRIWQVKSPKILF